MSISEMNKKLKDSLTPERYKHSINVMETAVKLAKKYGENIEKAQIAGLLHDCARDFNCEDSLRLCEKYGVKVSSFYILQPELLHGPLGAVLASDIYTVNDPDIKDAICCHTTGKENMTLLEKILYIADYIEPDRCFDEVGEIRRTAFNNIDASILMALDNSIKYIIDKGKMIHTDTIKARNYLICQGFYKNS